MPYIKVIQHEEAEGELKDIYDNLVETRGQLAEVHKIQSLNPQTIVSHMDLYMSIMFGKSPLKRYLREMIAVVVSAANDCEYCQEHHGAALNHFWKDEAKVQQLWEDYTILDLSTQERALCDYAFLLTRYPEKVNDYKHMKPLKDSALEDRAILDASLVISYFNFVNRMVLGLGVHLEEDEGEGYNYD